MACPSGSFECVPARLSATDILALAATSPPLRASPTAAAAESARRTRRPSGASWPAAAAALTGLVLGAQRTQAGHRATGHLKSRCSLRAGRSQCARGKIADFKVGQEVQGRVVSVKAALGIYVDIGAREDVLCRANQLQKPVAEYSVGDEVPGLRVSSIDAKKSQMELSTRRLPGEVKEGEHLRGVVTRPVSFGVFFDAGLAAQTLGPTLFLDRQPMEYTTGEVLDLVVVHALSEDRPWVTVTSRPKEVAGTLRELDGVMRRDVTGDTLQIDLGLNFLVDYGVTTDALYGLWRPQEPDSQAPGKVEGVAMAQLDRSSWQVNLFFANVGGTPCKDITLCTEVEAVVLRATRFGLFCDIGAECDALWPRHELPKDFWEYEVGESLAGLKVVNFDSGRSWLTLSRKKTAADFTQGDEVSGTVTSVMPYGIFVDIQASTKAFAPKRLLRRKTDRYQVGQTVELKIAELNLEKNEIGVGQATSAAMSIEELGRREGLLSAALLALGQRADFEDAP